MTPATASGARQHEVRRGIFITGTDTGVGKTWVGSRLAALWQAQGLPVAPRKPAESGCAPGPDGLLPADAQQYHKAIGGRGRLADICPYRFAAPLAPDQAAARAGRTLHLAELVAACAVPAGHFAVVEGAGGFCSPLATDGLNADLAAALGLPVLLVAADRLGAQNHVLLTAEAVARRGLSLAAVVLNALQPPGPDAPDNAGALRRWLPGVPLFACPHDAPPAALAALATALAGTRA